MGAEEVIDYRRTAVLELQERSSIIFDVASNLSFFKTRRILEAGGRFISLLPSATVIAGFLLAPVLKEKCTFYIVKSVDRDLKQVAQWLEEKPLETPIEITYRLSNVAQAINQLERGGVRGKIAIVVSNGTIK
ncbi:MAG: zinc-binding dehydrogenase [Nitrospirae bacterium]|nr:zinc-binding dehydrogenase [Nitrospirota bacterium]